MGKSSSKKKYDYASFKISRKTEDKLAEFHKYGDTQDELIDKVVSIAKKHRDVCEKEGKK